MALSHPPKLKRKYFTVEDANRALPLVRLIVADIVEQSRSVLELKQRLDHVSQFRSRQRDSRREQDIYAEELRQSEAELEAQEARLRDLIEELEKLGVELKGPEGLCDFPARIGGRDVYLCWRLGEPEVLYWHELHEGFAGRMPLRDLPSWSVPRSN